MVASDARAEPSDAEKLFAESADAYREGRFDRAIDLLEQAYKLSKEPVLLFNLAKAQEGKGDIPGAILSYEKYLSEAAMISDRGAIEKRVETLRAQLADKTALEKRAEEERLRAERAEQEKPSPSPIPWVLAGVGAAGIAVGGALAAVVQSKEADAQAEPVQQDAALLRDDAEQLAIGVNVAFAVGGTLLAGGLTWGIVDVVAKSEPSDPKVSLLIQPTGVLLAGWF
jgi:tetratricopeptide (TPR) repeat protein